MTEAPVEKIQVKEEVPCKRGNCSCPTICRGCKEDANFKDQFRISCDKCKHWFCRKCMMKSSNWKFCNNCDQKNKTEEKLEERMNLSTGVYI